MTPQKKSRWFQLALLALAFSSTLAILYARTQVYDASNYFRDVALLRQIKQLDSQWELNVLKSKIGLNQDYDPLVDPLTELNSLQTQLGIINTDRHIGKSTATVQSFRDAIQEKTKLIERFKSHNAVLRNSVTFLPVAANDIGLAAAQVSRTDHAVLNRVLGIVNDTLLATILYSQTAAFDNSNDIQADLDTLNVEKEKLPANIEDRVDIFSSHVRAVLREQTVVRTLLRDINAVPTAARIDEINNILNSEQENAAAQAQRTRRALLMVATALTCLLVYTAFRLIRYHQEIKRINRKLEQTNEHLEERVEERTRALQAMQAKLLTAARQAGMSEIATNVLHNVGNVLNSVNISAGVIHGKVRASESAGLARVAKLINEHGDDFGSFLTHDPRGKLLPGYLVKLAEAMASEQRSIISEIDALTKSIDHIKEIVTVQQSYATAGNITETVYVPNLIDDAVRMCADGLARNQVAIVRQFADVPAQTLDRHRILLILVNLIGNAKHAMDSAPSSQRQIILQVDPIKDNTLRIHIIDNGVGISAENLNRIFSHGFTTRKNGHGFGLHSCAIAAKAIGGTLTVQSAGQGLGATFTLELPVTQLPATVSRQSTL